MRLSFIALSPLDRLLARHARGRADGAKAYREVHMSELLATSADIHDLEEAFRQEAAL